LVRGREVGHQFPEPKFERPKNGVNFFGRTSGFVVFGQRIPRLSTVGNAIALCFTTQEIYDPFKHWGELTEIGVRSRFGPDGLTLALQTSFFFNQLDGEKFLSFVGSAQFPKIDRVISERIQVPRSRLRLGNSIGHGRSCHPFVGQTGQQRELLTSVGPPPFRKEDFLIPSEQSSARSKERRFTGEGGEMLVWVHRGHGKEHTQETENGPTEGGPIELSKS